MSSSDKFSVKPSLRLWLIISALIVVLLVAYPFVMQGLFPNDWATSGQFGDTFGFINALFTGLAFSGVIITILMQRYQLEDQIKSIKESKLEDKKERFENSLFLLINLHLDIIDKLELLNNYKRDVFKTYLLTIQTSSSELEGFVVLKKLTSSEFGRFQAIQNEAGIDELVKDNEFVSSDDKIILKEIVKNSDILNKFNETNQDTHETILRDAIKKSTKRHLNVLGHYFRNLYNIFRVIDTAAFLEDDEKKDFARLVRTQLSTVELLSIFYNSALEINEEVNGMKPMGFPKMTKLIQKYDILKHLNEDHLFHKIHLDIFKRSCIKAMDK